MINYPHIGMNILQMPKKTRQKRIKIFRTKGEFDFIEERVKELGKTDWHFYMRCELHKLEKKFNECPNCITPAEGEKVEKVHYVSDETYDMLLKLAKVMDKTPSLIVDEFIIMPLLRPVETA